ncbi:hypothetical protein CKO25_13820 [Thiocapsa imhoffii]|uniref:Uncharacterized protein n=1 Tax=Thiocapsa imhoffii TaxID=382777 RepID=A0A9X1B9C4_9GAMM|nr:hypothetical protein [Thiocapsa imhoffii]
MCYGSLKTTLKSIQTMAQPPAHETEKRDHHTPSVIPPQRAGRHQPEAAQPDGPSPRIATTRVPTP